MPPGLEAAILQCLEKDRTRRWRNVGELAAAIAPFGSARASGYAERVAGVLGIQVEPARVTRDKAWSDYEYDRKHRHE